MIYYFRNYFPDDEDRETYDDVYSAQLVKDAVSTISSSAATTTPTLEVFQVYQPVFTPNGPVDDTTSATGTENTAVLAKTNTTASCSIVLMDYSFGYSYGEPFVGEQPPISSLSSLEP